MASRHSYLPKRYLIPAFIGLGLTFLAVLVKTVEVPVLSELDRRLEWLAYDLRVRLMLPDAVEPDPRIVIVDIDEKSLLRLGRWPWSRSVIATLVDRVFESGAAVMAMDVMFTEAENPPGSDRPGEVAETGLAPVPDDAMHENSLSLADRSLADSLENRKVILGYVIADAATRKKGALPAPLVMDEWLVESIVLIDMESYIANLDRLQESASGGGFFSIMPDDDGIIRRAPLMARRDARLYGSLALETVRLFLGAEQIRLTPKPIGDQLVIESISLDGSTDIFTDGSGSVLVPYRGKSRSFSYISSADVINRDFPEDYFRDRIVLFGTTAIGLYDMRSTPVQSVFPGVEVHANVIAGLLDGDIPYEPPWALGANAALLLAIGVLSIFVIPFIRPLRIVIISVFMLVAVTAFNLWIWVEHGLVLAIVAPLLLIILIGMVDLVYGFLAEVRGRRRLKAAFGQYVPPAIVDEMNLNPDGNFTMQGESREMSVLFCDIRSFTSISESLTADELKKMLNYFFTPMTRIIFERRGTIDKYVGDMIMAFWGAPILDPEHRQHAVLGALAMLDELDKMQDGLSEHGWPNIQIGIGINSGMMNVGDMGSEYRRAYTVIGDAVNLGARLEELTKFYGVRLIISQTTAAGLDGFILRRLDRVVVKGKSKPVNIYEPVGMYGTVSADLLKEITESNRAMQYYLSADWEQARSTFAHLDRTWPGRAFYGLYLERIKSLQEAGVEDGWNGVFRHVSK